MKKLSSALAAACVLVSGASWAGVIHVANNGVDTGVCGAYALPCRSISQAILNAQVGDTVLVRPGRYGDNDGSGFIDRLGEEAGVRIDKKLTVLSTQGAAATVIDVGGTSPSVVEILADGVRFGGRNAGFTLSGSQQMGLSTGNVTGVVITGNIASGLPFAGFYLPSSGVVEARDNIATHNVIGIYTLTWNPPGYVVVANNVVQYNGDGITVGTVYGHRIVGNQVLGNTNVGIGVNYGTSYIAQNQVVGNRTGASVNGYSNDITLARGPLFTRNNFVGNRNNGVDVFAGPPGILPVLRENNVFGNGNCGVTHMSAAAQLDARNNFWGAATGPSFQEPADPACATSQPVRTTPFAAAEFDIR